MPISLSLSWYLYFINLIVLLLLHIAFISSSLHVWHSRAREYSCTSNLVPDDVNEANVSPLTRREPAIGLLTIERLHNVTRQFFVSPPPRIFRLFLPPAELFLPFDASLTVFFFPPFFFSPLLGRSWFYSSPFHFLFTARDLCSRMAAPPRLRCWRRDRNGKKKKSRAYGIFARFKDLGNMRGKRKKEPPAPPYKYTIDRYFFSRQGVGNFRERRNNDIYVHCNARPFNEDNLRCERNLRMNIFIGGKF